MEQAYHIPVLLHETIAALNILPTGTYVDCTFGGGGHSMAILERLGDGGRLLAFDQDEDARKNLPVDQRIIFVRENFRHLQRFARLHKISTVNGIVADLGVSSHQFDEAQRGFSTRHNAALDMRMDERQEKTASQVLQVYSEEQLHEVFEQYGEVTNARTLARTIVRARTTQPLNTVDAFMNAVRQVVKGNPKKYFAQVFQALRIEVNDEINALKELLEQVPPLLAPGGRVAIITFHSLEDRLVKNFFRRGTFEEPAEDVFGTSRPPGELKSLTRKPIVPGAEEVKRNPRSRSAKLRVAEKIVDGR